MARECVIRDWRGEVTVTVIVEEQAGGTSEGEGHKVRPNELRHNFNCDLRIGGSYLETKLRLMDG